MRKLSTNIGLAVVIFSVLAALAGLTAAALDLAAQLPAAPSPAPQAQAVDGYPADIYFSDLYQVAGTLPLHTWQPISLYGETFPACVVDVLKDRSTLTVNPDDSRLCGER